MIITGIIFGLFCLLREINIIIKTKTIGIINMFGILYGITYGLLTAYYIYYTNDNELPFHRHLTQTRADLWLWHISAILAYCIIQFVYYNNRNDNTIYRPTYTVKREDLNILQWTAIICAIIGAFSFYLWGKAYGSIMGVIIEGPLIRSGISYIYNPYSFMKRWVILLFIATFIFIKLIKLKKNVKFNSLILCGVIYLTVIFLLANDGRFMMAMYPLLIIFAFIDVLNPGKINKKKLILISIFAIIAISLISELNAITYYIRTDELLEDDVMGEENFIIDEFEYIFISAQQSSTQCLTEGSPYLFIDDVLLSLFSWLPHNLKPDLELINVWDYNTNLYYAGTFAGQMPCDFITYCIYSLGGGGFIFIAIFWAIILRGVDKLVQIGNSPLLEALGYFIMFRFIYLVNYNSFHSFVMSLFPLFITIVIWHMVKRIYNLTNDAIN